MRFYTPKEVAEMCGVSLITVYNWIKKGRIRAESLGKKYKKYIPETEIPTFLRERGVDK